jgi:hypothetical protein
MRLRLRLRLRLMMRLKSINYTLRLSSGKEHKGIHEVSQRLRPCELLSETRALSPIIHNTILLFFGFLA